MGSENRIVPLWVFRYPQSLDLVHLNFKPSSHPINVFRRRCIMFKSTFDCRNKPPCGKTAGYRPEEPGKDNIGLRQGYGVWNEIIRGCRGVYSIFLLKEHPEAFLAPSNT